MFERDVSVLGSALAEFTACVPNAYPCRSHEDSVSYHIWWGRYAPLLECSLYLPLNKYRLNNFLQDAWEYVHNPYGLLRSAWNLDSTPYVTRHNETSGMVSVVVI